MRRIARIARAKPARTSGSPTASLIGPPMDVPMATRRPARSASAAATGIMRAWAMRDRGAGGRSSCRPPGAPEVTENGAIARLQADDAPGGEIAGQIHNGRRELAGGAARRQADE